MNRLLYQEKNPYIKAAVDAYENVFGTQVKFIQNGGTIGAADYLHSILKVPVVFMGFAQASDNMHAPNEKFYLPNFFRGIETIKKFIQNISLLNTKNNLHATFIIDAHCHAGKGDGLIGPWDTRASLKKFLSWSYKAGVQK